jgi:hypothetical protein
VDCCNDFRSVFCEKVYWLSLHFRPVLAKGDFCHYNSIAIVFMIRHFQNGFYVFCSNKRNVLYRLIGLEYYDLKTHY